MSGQGQMEAVGLLMLAVALLGMCLILGRTIHGQYQCANGTVAGGLAGSGCATGGDQLAGLPAPAAMPATARGGRGASAPASTSGATTSAAATTPASRGFLQSFGSSLLDGIVGNFVPPSADWGQAWSEIKGIATDPLGSARNALAALAANAGKLGEGAGKLASGDQEYLGAAAGTLVAGMITPNKAGILNGLKAAAKGATKEVLKDAIRGVGHSTDDFFKAMKKAGKELTQEEKDAFELAAAQRYQERLDASRKNPNVPAPNGRAITEELAAETYDVKLGHDLHPILDQSAKPVGIGADREWAVVTDEGLRNGVQSQQGGYWWLDEKGRQAATDLRKGPTLRGDEANRLREDVSRRLEKR
jgi:hypothetical protein